MQKQDVREQVWDILEESGEARFPYPPHGRIPNFAGADVAATRLTETSVWDDAETIKCNPDAPQLPVRRAALRAGKTVYMPVPRLADSNPFLRLTPEEVDDIEAATTVAGSAEYGTPVTAEEVVDIDLVVSGSVAVTPNGGRIGKGEGYSDLEFAVLNGVEAVGAWTTVATTVHERQVLDRETASAVEFDAYDVPLDLICTPERTLRLERGDRPTGIDWDALDMATVEEIPVLRRLRADE